MFDHSCSTGFGVAMSPCDSSGYRGQKLRCFQTSTYALKSTKKTIIFCVSEVVHTYMTSSKADNARRRFAAALGVWPQPRSGLRIGLCWGAALS